LANELQQTRFGILCLTPENLTAPWLLFEAGALSKAVDESNVCPLLLELQPTDITGPLAQFQAIKADKEGVWSLVKAINTSLGDLARDEIIINKVFEVLWSDFETSIKAIPENAQEIDNRRRLPEDLLEEVLSLVREQSRMLSSIQNPKITIKSTMDDDHLKRLGDISQFIIKTEDQIRKYEDMANASKTDEFSDRLFEWIKTSQEDLIQAKELYKEELDEHLKYLLYRFNPKSIS
jgi:hypothetical protein